MQPFMLGRISRIIQITIVRRVTEVDSDQEETCGMSTIDGEQHHGKEQLC